MAFGDECERDEDDGGGEREIDEEDPAPGNMLDEPSADDGAGSGGDGGESGPGADGASAGLFVEIGADDGEAAGHERGGADSLKTAGGDELIDVGRIRRRRSRWRR